MEWVLKEVLQPVALRVATAASALMVGVGMAEGHSPQVIEALTLLFLVAGEIVVDRRQVRKQVRRAGGQN